MVKLVKVDKYKQPYIGVEGYGFCPYCGGFQHIQVVQDIVTMGDDKAQVPDIYSQCTYCGDKWYGCRDYGYQYDATVTYYQMKARGLRIMPVPPIYSANYQGGIYVANHYDSAANQYNPGQRT